LSGRGAVHDIGETHLRHEDAEDFVGATSARQHSANRVADISPTSVMSKAFVFGELIMRFILNCSATSMTKASAVEVSRTVTPIMIAKSGPTGDSMLSTVLMTEIEFVATL
jgi:hypothetical protein